MSWWDELVGWRPAQDHRRSVGRAWYSAPMAQQSSPPVSWVVPGGKQDWLVGTGATRAERTLMWAASLGGVALYGWAWTTDQYQWGWWQYLLAMVVAADLFGGAVANATNSAKRQYFGPLSPDAGPAGRLVHRQLLFAAMHVYPFLVVGLFPGGTWIWAIVVYGGMLASVTLLDRWCPVYLQRPVAVLILVAAIVGNALVAAPEGWAWFIPVFVAKLVVGHAVREEPYRPAETDSLADRPAGRGAERGA